MYKEIKLTKGVELATGFNYLCYMGLTYAEIEITNSDDLALERNGHLEKDKVRKILVNALVDSGAYMLTISEDVRVRLGLPVRERRWAELADGQRIKVDVAGAVEVRFENRLSITSAFVVPNGTETLLGAIPMEMMHAGLRRGRTH